MNASWGARPGGSAAAERPRWLRSGLGSTLGVLSVALAMVAVGVGGFLTPSPAAPAKTDSAAAVPTVVPPSRHKHRVIAYYFHGNFRCITCRTMEAYSREAIESAFAKQLEDGRLVWRTVNIDLKGNEHFGKEYKLYTRSLVLVNEVRGKPAQWKNLEKIWQLVRDKDAFLQYVRDETTSYLTERS